MSDSDEITADESLVIAKQVIASAVLWREGSEDAAQALILALPQPDSLGVIYGMWQSAIESIAAISGVPPAEVLQDIATNIAAGSFDDAGTAVDEDAVMARVRERESRLDPYTRVMRQLAENGWHDDELSDGPDHLLADLSELMQSHEDLMQQLARSERERASLQLRYENVLTERNRAVNEVRADRARSDRQRFERTRVDV